MKLLVITNNPNRASFKQRIGVYLDILHDNDIHCEVFKLPSHFSARLKFFRRAACFDGVVLHKKKLNFFDAIWLHRHSKKLIYNFDDAIMYSDKAPDRNSRSHYIPFRRTVRLADMVITGSSYLAEHARKFNCNVIVLPIGLKVGDYKLARPIKSDDKVRLVWIGSKTTLEYLTEIKPALEEIGSRFDNVVLRIVCDDFFDLQNMPVEKRLWSEDARGIDLATSDIGLAPLPDNRFTRGKCSFKVLEYSSAGLPVIASPIGTNAKYVKDGVTGFLTIDTRQWIDRITELIENPNLRKRMGREGQAYAEKFDMTVIGKQLVNLIQGCLDNTED
jgi:glycosyltransferase involved in cell wall biosynthesis